MGTDWPCTQNYKVTDVYQCCWLCGAKSNLIEICESVGRMNECLSARGKAQKKTQSRLQRSRFQLPFTKRNHCWFDTIGFRYNRKSRIMISFYSDLTGNFLIMIWLDWITLFFLIKFTGRYTGLLRTSERIQTHTISCNLKGKLRQINWRLL